MSSKSLKIPKAQLQQLSTLDQTYFPYPWTEQQWESALSKNSYTFVFISMSDDSEILGFSLLEKVPSADQAHLLKIFIQPTSRKKGLAQELLRRSIEALDVPEVYLEVEVANKEAIKFYRSFGFEELCIKKRFYSDGSDACAMLLKK